MNDQNDQLDIRHPQINEVVTRSNIFVLNDLISFLETRDAACKSPRRKTAIEDAKVYARKYHMEASLNGVRPPEPFEAPTRNYSQGNIRALLVFLGCLFGVAALVFGILIATGGV